MLLQLMNDVMCCFVLFTFCFIDVITIIPNLWKFHIILWFIVNILQQFNIKRVINDFVGSWLTILTEFLYWIHEMYQLDNWFCAVEIKICLKWQSLNKTCLVALFILHFRCIFATLSSSLLPISSSEYHNHIISFLEILNCSLQQYLLLQI